jgi:uncharacterized membrane protein YfcA
MDPLLAVGGFFVGVIVGLTGMGGGALMTPMLVLFFGVQPLAAVSSDLVTSAVMKPFGAAVHLRSGTVDRRLVKWLCLGSVPSAFGGVLLARALGSGEQVQGVIKTALGIALLVAATALVVKAYLKLREARRGEETAGFATITVRPVATVVAGAVGGLIVGMTSVGSGSLIIIALLALYPALKASDLVGTDIVQAVPLVLAAAVGHAFFGDLQLDVTLALLVGSVPGVILGSLVSARAPGGIVRPVLGLVLVASGLKLLDVSTVATGVILVAIVVLGPPAWILARRRNAVPAPPEQPELAGAGCDAGR